MDNVAVDGRFKFIDEVVAIDEHRSFFFLALLGLLIAAGDDTGKGIIQ